MKNKENLTEKMVIFIVKILTIIWVIIFIVALNSCTSHKVIAYKKGSEPSHKIEIILAEKDVEFYDSLGVKNTLVKFIEVTPNNYWWLVKQEFDGHKVPKMMSQKTVEYYLNIK